MCFDSDNCPNSWSDNAFCQGFTHSNGLTLATSLGAARVRSRIQFLREWGCGMRVTLPPSQNPSFATCLSMSLPLARVKPRTPWRTWWRNPFREKSRRLAVRRVCRWFVGLVILPRRGVACWTPGTPGTLFLYCGISPLITRKNTNQVASDIQCKNIVLCVLTCPRTPFPVCLSCVV